MKLNQLYLKKIFYLISKRQKKSLLILVFFLIIGMFLEVFGLGLLIPILSILTDPSVINEIQFLSYLKSIFSEYSDNLFYILFLSVFLFIYIIKTLLLITLNYKQNKFLTNLSATVLNKLFNSYLNQSYDFHLKINSSDLIKNIQVEANYFNTFITSLLSILVETGFVLAIVSTLIYLEPLGALSIGLFYGILSFLFLRLTKNKIGEWGVLRQNLDKDLSKIAVESFGFIKDIIVQDKTFFFKSNFNRKNLQKSKLNANRITLSQIPRFYLELISILGLVSFLIIMLAQGKGNTELISILGVFVAATFRLIPSLNRIISSFQSMKFYKDSINIIYNEIIKSEAILNNFSKNTHTFSKKIAVNNVSFSYSQNQILTGVNFEIYKNDVVGIIGESGSGKSTILDLLMGLQKPNVGKITADEFDISELNQTWLNNIAYVSQDTYLMNDSIINNIALGLKESEIDRELVFDTLKKVQLYEFVNSLENNLDTLVGERGAQLSGGQKQRIGVARALYLNRNILILDEATSALDNTVEKKLLESIYNLKSKITIIMISHRIETLKNCDYILELSEKTVTKKIVK